MLRMLYKWYCAAIRKYIKGKGERVELLCHFFGNMGTGLGTHLRRMAYAPLFQQGRPTLGKFCILTGPENISVGENVGFGPMCCIYAHDGTLVIGNNVSFNAHVLIAPADGGTIIIGDNCMIGPGTVLRAANHTFDRMDIPMREQGHTPGVIILEEDVWIAANCTILPGVTIKRGAIVGAGAVVTRDVEPFTLVGGVPARLIRRRQ